MPQAKKVLLLGKEGQLGFALQRALSVLGVVYACNRLACDLTNPAQLEQTIQQISPDIIVNAAAYTAVDKAETEAVLAFQINAEAPRVLAELAKANKAHLIHYSTDYVFDGSKSSSYQEEDLCCPLNQYGASKLAGEKAIEAIGGRYWILRTSWVFSHYGHNFLKTILRLARAQTDIKVVNDQYGAPTSADLLADVTVHMLWKAGLQGEYPSGIYHLTSEGKTSWYGFAEMILTTAASLGLETCLLKDKLVPIPAIAYSQPAARPYNSCLNIAKLKQTFDLQPPPWQWHVQHTLRQLLWK